MRNRVYITSIKDKNDISSESDLTNGIINEWTDEHKNVLMFVPSLNGLFLNGKKYCSINEFQNDPSAQSVMKLEIIHDVDGEPKHNTNYIALAQQRLKKDFGIETLLLGVEYTMNNVYDRKIYINMNVGECVQIFTNKNFGFSFEEQNNECAVIDRNFIIHALKVPENGSPAQILIKSNFDNSVLYEINIFIRNGYNVNIYEDSMISNVLSNMEHEEIITNYSAMINMYTNDRERIRNNPYANNEIIKEYGENVIANQEAGKYIQNP